ncbi:MAG: hypothetical protein ACM3X7_03815 [Solirubrobacterales bacterium]
MFIINAVERCCYILNQKFKKRVTAVSAVVMASGIIFPVASVIASPYKTGWVKVDGTWYYYNSKGAKVSNRWQQDTSGRWFYLGSNGAMVTNGWAQDSSKNWFYLGSDGAVVTNGWAQDSSKNWFYLGDTGIMATSSWVEYNGKSYYLNSGGDLAMNTTTPDGSTVDSTGAKVTSGTGSNQHGVNPPNGGQMGGTPPSGSQPVGAPPDGGNGGSPTVNTGTGAYNLTNGETLTGGTYSSINADENAVRADNKVTATLNNVTVNKTLGAASSNDASSFYGLNSAVLAANNSTLNITGGTVNASAEGANGVFAYDGATINIQDTAINVTGGNSGGIEVAGGGKLNATNLTVNSKVKAAIRSDRGGGTMVVEGGTYTTEGSSGAPAIYSTAAITVSNATLTANTSEAVVVEGMNSVTLNNCKVTGNMTGTSGNSSENIHNVMLYQSMSGDAQVGNSSFKMTGGSLTSKNGDMFYVTNTDCTIQLTDVDVNLADNTNLLVVSGNDASRGWGTVGANGGVCGFTASNQTLTGDIKVDSISKLSMNISDSSNFTGSINSDGTKAASLSVTVDSSSKWTLTADSYVTEFHGSMSNVNTNGHTLYVNGVAMN